MSQQPTSTPSKSVKKGAADAMEAFDVSHHIVEETELQWDQLGLDLDLKHGQIRSVNTDHRANLVAQFRSNPPRIIDLTTVLDQGMFISTPRLLFWMQP